MAKQIDFNRFLSNIEPSQTTVDYISSIQTNLRNYLSNHRRYHSIIIDTFLSGSYAKYTSIRPTKDDKKRDVDIVIVTNYNKTCNPIAILKELYDVLQEKSIYKNAVIQSHSVSVVLAGISVDIVPVIRHDSLVNAFYIGSSKDGTWQATDPIGHRLWSTEVNTRCKSQYKPLVKLFKWWRHSNCPIDKKYPKGIVLEKIIADNIGDTSLSRENLVIGTMQNIVNQYQDDIANMDLPFIDDPSDKIQGNNLLNGYKFEDFKAFYEKLEEHLKKLNDCGTDNTVWQEILGTEFPSSQSKNAAVSFRGQNDVLAVPHRQKPLWSMRRTGAVFITAKVIDVDGKVSNYENDSYSIDKGCTIIYTANYNSCKRHRIMWQIVNTGYEARYCLRGGFEESNLDANSRKEYTKYNGKHYVQCFVIDRYGNCVAKSKEFFINVK